MKGDYRMRIFLAILAVVLGSSAALAADPVVQAGGTYDRGVIKAAPSNPFAGLYVGVDAGAEANDISLTVPGFGDFSGISADGFRGSVHLGGNACVDVGCVGVEGAYGLSDANVEVGPLGSVLEADDFAKLLVTAKARFGNSYVGARAGYEWQDWTAIGEVDVNTGWWVIGGEVGTMVTGGGVLRLVVDYSILDSVEVDGIGGAGNREITKALEDTDKLAVSLGLSYYTGFGQSLTSLIDR